METPIIPWPDGVAAIVNLSNTTLQENRRNGDSPQLYAVGSRSLVTTEADVLAWIKSKAVPPTYRCREATK